MYPYSWDNLRDIQAYKSVSSNAFHKNERNILKQSGTNLDTSVK